MDISEAPSVPALRASTHEPDLGEPRRALIVSATRPRQHAFLRRLPSARYARVIDVLLTWQEG